MFQDKNCNNCPLCKSRNYGGSETCSGMSTQNDQYVIRDHILVASFRIKKNSEFMIFFSFFITVVAYQSYRSGQLTVSGRAFSG